MDPQILQDLCPQSQQTPLLAFAWIFLGAAGLITALRLYSKSKQLGGITADDYAALASTVSLPLLYPHASYPTLRS